MKGSLFHNVNSEKKKEKKKKTQHFMSLFF